MLVTIIVNIKTDDLFIYSEFQFKFFLPSHHSILNHSLEILVTKADGFWFACSPQVFPDVSLTKALPFLGGVRSWFARSRSHYDEGS